MLGVGKKGRRKRAMQYTTTAEEEDLCIQYKAKKSLKCFV